MEEQGKNLPSHMQTEKGSLLGVDKEKKSPKVSPRLKVRIVGQSNLGFVPDAAEPEQTSRKMSQNSGRGPAPLPRNSGSHSSSDDDHP